MASELMLGTCHYLAGEALEFAALTPMLRPMVRRLRPSASPHPLLFIHVPRAAGMSIRSAMGMGHRAHRTLTYYRAMYPQELAGKTTFAVIRDPMARFCSAYQFVVAQGAENAGLNGVGRMMTRRVKSIDDYLQFLEARKHRLDRLDPVMRSQWHYVVDEVNSSTVDALFSLEQCTAALNDFLVAHGFRDVGWMNRSQRATCTLDRVQTRRVERLYARDVELYERARRSVNGSALSGGKLQTLLAANSRRITRRAFH